MKLPLLLTNLLKPKPVEGGEVYLSLLLDRATVGVSVWEKRGTKVNLLGKQVTEALLGESWTDRIAAVQRACETLGENCDVPDVERAILGLSSLYIDADGKIERHIRPHIKELVRHLEIQPIGFVSIADAIIHQLKAEEGVPANAILVELLGNQICVYLYKVGKHIGKVNLEHKNRIVETIEQGINSFVETEILPSRILVFGGTTEQRDEVAKALLKHPWQNQANFLHFPKIEALSADVLVSSITTAGVSELSDDGDDTVSAVQGEGESKQTAYEKSPREQEGKPQVRVSQKESIGEDVSLAERVFDEPVENVAMVDPQDLGFHTSEEETVYEADRKRSISPRPRVPHASSTRADNNNENSGARGIVALLPYALRINGRPYLVLIAGALLTAMIIGVMYWFLPRAQVIVYLEPKPVEATSKLIIDPTVQVADPVTAVIPGKKVETTISGTKSIPVTGKKKIGDPAKGVVTIYNKTLSSRVLKKGSKLSSGSITFTLDNDVLVASASDSFASGSRTFGQVKAAITASQIGTQGNLAADSVFTFDSIDSSVLIARNEQQMTGGSSREVTVVTRADYDAVVSAITKELVEQAKTQLQSGVSGGEQLIDETITTAVSERAFAQELDQEVSEVSGTITLSVSGIAYRLVDVQFVLSDSLRTSLPSGYGLSLDSFKTKTSDLKVRKDGKIDVVATVAAIGLPTVEAEQIKSQIVGKSTTEATQIIQAITGVGGVTIKFLYNPLQDRLPINRGNISVDIYSR